MKLQAGELSLARSFSGHEFRMPYEFHQLDPAYQGLSLEHRLRDQACCGFTGVPGMAVFSEGFLFVAFVDFFVFAVLVLESFLIHLIGL